MNSLESTNLENNYYSVIIPGKVSWYNTSEKNLTTYYIFFDKEFAFNYASANIGESFIVKQIDLEHFKENLPTSLFGKVIIKYLEKDLPSYQEEL